MGDDRQGTGHGEGFWRAGLAAPADPLDGELRAETGGKLAAHHRLPWPERRGGVPRQGGIVLGGEEVDGPAVVVRPLGAHLQAAGVRVGQGVEVEELHRAQAGDGDVLLRREAPDQALGLFPVQRLAVGGIVVDGHIEAGGVLGGDDLPLPQVEGQGARDHHHHHGGQDADVGQPHGVALHAVEHPGYADEVAGLVVEPLVFPQQLQQGDAPGGEQAVGAHNHQQHRDEIEAHGHGGILGDHGDEVARPQADGPDHRHEPAGAGLLLPHVPAVEQLDGLAEPHPEQVQRQGQQEQQPEERRRFEHGGQGEGGVEGDGELEQGDQGHGGQLVEDHPQRQPAANTQQGGVQALPALDQGEVPLAHAQDVVEAQLLLALLHQEAVDVQQQHRGQHPRHEHPDLHHDQHVGKAPHLQHAGVGAQGGHDVKGGSEPRQGQQVGDEKAVVLPHPPGGQLGIKAVTHASHLRRPAGSAFR